MLLISLSLLSTLSAQTRPERELYNLLDHDLNQEDAIKAFKPKEEAILVLSRLFPSAFRKTYSYPKIGCWEISLQNAYPLTVLCTLHASENTVRAVYKLCPEAACEAIRFCCELEFAPHIIKFLVAEHPQALNQVDSFDQSVLHRMFSASEFPSKEVIQILTESNKAGLLLKDYCGETPLHHALKKGLNLETLRFFVDPEGAVLKIQCKEGKTPLHIACRENAGMKVIKFLVDSYPDALNMKDTADYVPLHHACRARVASLELIQYLVDRNPSVLTRSPRKYSSAPPTPRTTSYRGGTPLHVASGMKRRSNIILYLIAKAPSALDEMDNIWELPIHRACASSDAATVAILLKSKPSGYYLGKYPVFSKTPFAKAIENDNFPVLKYLTETDAWGEVIPLHFACEKGSYALIRLLLDKYPHAAKEVDEKGRTPLAVYAARNDADMDMIELLFGTHQEALQILDCDGNPPLSQAQNYAFMKHLFQHLTPGRPSKRARLK